MSLTLAYWLVPSSLQANDANKLNIRMNLSGANNEELEETPWCIGGDYTFIINKYFSALAGGAYYSDLGINKKWKHENYVCHFNNTEENMFTINVSLRYNQKLKEFRKCSLGYFLEPGLQYCPSSSISINMPTTNNGNEIQIGHNSGKLFYQNHVGIYCNTEQKETNTSIRFDLSYYISNIDFFYAYRDLNLQAINLQAALPKNELINGLRLSIYLEF